LKLFSLQAFQKTEAFFFAGIAAAVFIFYPDLFLVKTAMLTGDHSSQHYPWAYLLSNALKQGQIPFWTMSSQAGFPVTAEGQIGSFYPPNLLFMGLLPTRSGYSYLHVFHFLIAGWGLYAYARSISLTRLAAFAAAYVYLFGTVYGGAYYNITSLKTLAWLPAMLYAVEVFLRTPQKRFLFFIAFAAACTILAGYLQVAVYSLCFFVLYAGLRLWFFTSQTRSLYEKLRRNWDIALALMLGAVLTLPQLWLTYDLARLSTRAVSSEEFAYVGSLFPGALLTLLYPVSQGLFRGNSLYLGVGAVLFFLTPFFSKEFRRDGCFKIWALLTFLFLALALGEWSPIYVGLIKLTHFYSFRTPAKFLFFICLGLSVLCGMGVQTFENSIREKVWSPAVRAAARVYLVLASGTGILIASLNGLLIAAPSQVREWGYVLVEKLFYGRMGHPHELEVYHRKWDGYMDAAVQMLTPSNFWNALGLTMIALGTGVALILTFSRKARPLIFYGVLVFLAADLYLFSWNDIRKDFGRYPQLRQTPVFETLRKDNEAGRGGRLYGFREADEMLPLMPSTNILYGIDDVGAYSPLVMRRYLEIMGPFGNVDDSNGFPPASVNFIEKHLSLLDFLNVSHILSPQELRFEGWELAAEEHDEFSLYLYRSTRPRAAGYFVSSFIFFENWKDLRGAWLDKGSNPAETLYFELSEKAKLPREAVPQPQRADSVKVVLNKMNSAGEEIWQLSTDHAGFFVRPIVYASGWVCEVNGQTAPVLKANGLFQAVWIPNRGNWTLHFHYHPFALEKRESV